MELLTNPQKLAAYREQAAALTAQMTLEEKVSQTLYNAPAIPRLGIPAYTGGTRRFTVCRAARLPVFPQAIAMAAAFDEEMMEKVGEAVSTEARAKYNAQCAAGDRDIYKGLTCWAPNVNIFRDPRWGRGHETYGEDPYLTSRLAVRFIQGMQGHDPDHLRTACLRQAFCRTQRSRSRASFLQRRSERQGHGRNLPARLPRLRAGGKGRNRHGGVQPAERCPLLRQSGAA